MIRLKLCFYCDIELKHLSHFPLLGDYTHEFTFRGSYKKRFAPSIVHLRIERNSRKPDQSQAGSPLAVC